MGKTDDKEVIGRQGFPIDWLEREHYQSPRRNYSVQGSDWQRRVDFDRLRSDRLARAKQMMEKHEFDALIMFKGENIRYTCSVFQGNWKNNIFIRYAVLPRGAKTPTLFETAGSDLQCARIDAPWLEGNIRPAITWKWSESAETYMVDRMVDSIVEVLKENGIPLNGKIGIDIMDLQSYNAFGRKGVNLVNGWPALSEARVLKTPEEIELLKISSTVGDTCMWKIRNEWLKPGIREADITAKVNELLYEEGFDFVYDIICASGGNTSPYRRWHTDRMMRDGDLVIVDINAIGPGGYFVDFVRTFKIGGRWTKQEKALYREVYDNMYAGMTALKPGNTTADVAKHFPEYDDDKYGTVTLQQFAHSIGLDLYEGMWISRAYSLKYPVEIKENMYFAIETFAGKPHLPQTVRLEENVLVGPDGPIVFTNAAHYDECIEGSPYYDFAGKARLEPLE
ncbi:MAG: Xaa-Pro peptidase family protein [Actinomycetota bacterium]